MRGDDDGAAPFIREELRIVSSKKKRRGKRGTPRKSKGGDSDMDEDGARSPRRSDSIDGDGFKQHSDDEQDWSDVDDDIYKNKKSISMKEAILGTLIDECIRLDTEKYGLFSVPVPKEEFPDYYEVIKTPMDYGTMKDKLERGEYRSAQAMQKDFILVMQNCLQFNAKDSDIVKEARA
ncbi:hypothetical protein THAPSDRAFT_263817, partial [Thalassiosira pseudonana CCMP1335]